MNLLNSIAQKIGFYPKVEVDNRIKRARSAGYQQGLVHNFRSFDAGDMNRLMTDWIQDGQPIDSDIFNNFLLMRARSNDLFKNTAHVKKFINLCKKNITGPYGFKLQMKIKNPDGTRDSLAEKKIEEAWSQWSQRENCTVSGDLTFRDVQLLGITSAVRDGEFLVRAIPDANRPFGFALQLIESDMLDSSFNTRLNNGNVVRMGVETDPWRRPVAYHIKKVNADYGIFQIVTMERERIEARFIYHVFDKLWIGQTRGIPWYVASMLDIKFLRNYKFAGLVNATATANLPYFITEGETTPNKAVHDRVDETTGNYIIESEPGKAQYLPFGYDLQVPQVNFPTPQYEQYVKSVSKDIATGMDASYASLTGDMSEANYSSTRWGALDERDGWALWQEWFTETFLNRAFSEWLFWSLGSQTIKLPTSKYYQFNKPNFIGRVFPWVDPDKDMRAKRGELQCCLTSLQRAIAERGDDMEEIFQEIQNTEEMAKKYGIILNFDEKSAPPTAGGPDMGTPIGGNGKKNGKTVMVE